MRWSEINETTKPEFTVVRFSLTSTKHSKEVVKNVFDPFVKMVDKEMKSLKGKWNGQNGYVFKDEEKAKQAQALMTGFNKEWQQMKNDYPEGDHPSLDSQVAIDYFERAKKKSALP